MDYYTINFIKLYEIYVHMHHITTSAWVECMCVATIGGAPQPTTHSPHTMDTGAKLTRPFPWPIVIS